MVQLKQLRKCQLRGNECEMFIFVLKKLPVIGESAVTRLGGKVGIMKGPTTSTGITLMKSMLFSLAASHAAFSASVFDTKYICKECRTNHKLIKKKQFG